MYVCVYYVCDVCMYKLSRTTDYQTPRYGNRVRPLWWDAAHTIPSTVPAIIIQVTL